MRLSLLSFTLAACAGLPGLDLPQVTFHGFVSQGGLLSQDNNYLAEDSSKGSLQFNEIALNASSQISPRLRVGMQFFARDLGQFGNDEVTIDWAFADYRQSDLLGVRVGRYKLPLGLYNESMDLDLAFTSVILPQAVYNTGYREILSGQNGVQLYGHLPVKAFDYQIHVGTQSFATDSYLGNVLTEGDVGLTSVDSIKDKYVYGAQLGWRTPIDGLHLVASWVQAVGFRADGTKVIAGANAQPVIDISTGMPVPNEYVFGDLTTRVSSRFDQLSIIDAGAEYQVGDWTLAGEYRLYYSNGEVIVDVPATALSAASHQVIPTRIRNEGVYGLASYRIDESWEVGTYYGIYWDDRNQRTGSPSAYQRDLALSLRWDVDPAWAVKLEGHLMDGTALLLTSENPDGARAHWWMLAAKTTVSF